MIIAEMAFYLFAGIVLLSALMVVSARNPVHSVLFLILAFFNAAGLFVLIGAEYIAMTLVIVYVGAVAVLFLFVVMMLDVNFAELRQGFLRYLPLGLSIAVVLFVELFVMVQATLISHEDRVEGRSPVPEGMTNAEAIGNLLYTDYIYPFQLSGVVLLVAMIGAIVLTLRHRPGVRRQDVTRQVSRRRQDSVELVDVKSREGI